MGGCELPRRTRSTLMVPTSLKSGVDADTGEIAGCGECWVCFAAGRILNAKTARPR